MDCWLPGGTYAASRSSRRLILYCKRSSVKGCTGKYERVLLPRASETACMELGAQHPHADDIELMVLDFVDAFYQIPVRQEERQFFCAQVAGR
eukprot:4334931-Amphidinium_carterae.1